MATRHLEEAPMWIWIAVAVAVVAVGAVVWWSSGRARRFGDDSGSRRAQVEGQVENYRTQGNAPTHDFRL